MLRSDHAQRLVAHDGRETEQVRHRIFRRQREGQILGLLEEGAKARLLDWSLEVEGGSRNVRVWDNYITQSMIMIANAATSIGPLYIWRGNPNVSGETIATRGGGDEDQMAGLQESIDGLRQRLQVDAHFGGHGDQPECAACVFQEQVLCMLAGDARLDVAAFLDGEDGLVLVQALAEVQAQVRVPEMDRWPGEVHHSRVDPRMSAVVFRFLALMKDAGLDPGDYGLRTEAELRIFRAAARKLKSERGDRISAELVIAGAIVQVEPESLVPVPNDEVKVAIVIHVAQSGGKGVVSVSGNAGDAHPGPRVGGAGVRMLIRSRPWG